MYGSTSSSSSSSLVFRNICGACEDEHKKCYSFRSSDENKHQCTCGHQDNQLVVESGHTQQGWLPRLVGVELNPGPCQGAVGEGKCDQGCTLTPKEVKDIAPDGQCYCGHSIVRHGVHTAQSTVSVEIAAKLDKLGEALSKFDTPQRKRKAEVRSTEKQKSLLRRLRKRNPDEVCDICGKGYPGMIAAHVVPWALRDALDEYYDNQSTKVQQLLPTSSFHEMNGLILCPTCDKAFELHDINIEADGRISVATARRTAFPKLHGRHVAWSTSIDHDMRYPTSELLKYRLTLPKATKGIGQRALGVIPFTRDKGTKRQKREKEQEKDEEAEEEEEEEEEGEEEEEEMNDVLKNAGFSGAEIASLRSAFSATQLRNATRATKEPLLQKRPLRTDAYVRHMEKQGWELSLDTGNEMYFFHPDTCKVWVRLRGG